MRKDTRLSLLFCTASDEKRTRLLLLVNEHIWAHDCTNKSANNNFPAKQIIKLSLRQGVHYPITSHNTSGHT